MKKKLNEFDKICLYCMSVEPIVCNFLETYFAKENFEYTLTGDGLDMTYSLKKDDIEAELYLHNIFLEIATIDRDERPLRFDKRLVQEEEWDMAKITTVCMSRLKVFIEMCKERDHKKVIEKLKNDKSYERIRIWTEKPKKPADQHNND